MASADPYLREFGPESLAFRAVPVAHRITCSPTRILQIVFIIITANTLIRILFEEFISSTFFTNGEAIVQGILSVLSKVMKRSVFIVTDFFVFTISIYTYIVPPPSSEKFGNEQCVVISFLGAIELTYPFDTFTQHFPTFHSIGLKIIGTKCLPLDHS